MNGATIDLSKPRNDDLIWYMQPKVIITQTQIVSNNENVVILWNKHYYSLIINITTNECKMDKIYSFLIDNQILNLNYASIENSDRENIFFNSSYIT